MKELALAAIVALAFTTEAAVGFGATLIALALGSLVTPMGEMLLAFVPLNLVLSLAIVVRGARAVDVRFLATRMVPAMAVGFPIGLVAFERLPRSRLQLAFAAFVLVLASIELVRMARSSKADRPLSRALAIALLVLGGVAHGAFASGGPPAVYVGARTLPDKARFRATMSALWLVLNGVLVLVYLARGQVNAATLRESMVLAPGLAVGLVAGEILHGRLPARTFRAFVFGLLFAVAVVIGART